MTRRNVLFFFASLCFALSGCADSAMQPQQNAASSIKNVSLRASKGAPCAPQNGLAYTANATLLVCADNDGKGLVWKSAGVEVPITEKGEAGEDCAKAGILGLDKAGAILYCGDDPGQTP